jgi:hypothetical protein
MTKMCRFVPAGFITSNWNFKKVHFLIKKKLPPSFPPSTQSNPFLMFTPKIPGGFRADKPVVYPCIVSECFLKKILWGFFIFFRIRMLPNGNICRFLMQCNNSEGGQLKDGGKKSQQFRQQGFAGVIYRQSHRDVKAALILHSVDEDENPWRESHDWGA